MKISEIILERGAPPTYTDYTDPSAKGPNGEKLVVNGQGQVGYFKQQGRSTSFVAYDPKAQSAKPAAATSEPDPYAIDYSDAMTGMQGTPSSEPVSPEKAAAVQRVLLSFVPGIGTALDVKDAIEAASKGEYGEAAASSAFALLGLLPVVGAPTARAIAAAKNFARANPKVVQAMKGKEAAPAAKSTPATPTTPKATPDPVIQKGQAALGGGGVVAGAAMANKGTDAASAAKAAPEPAATPSGLSTAQKVGVGGVAGAAVGAGVATAADKNKPQAQDQTQATKSVDKAEPASATTQYQIKPGDNLTKISRQFGTTINDIMKLNPQIKDPNLIYAGKTLNIPNTVKEHSSELARLLRISQRLKY